MFIKVTNSGGRRYAQLVESFRNDAGQPRQRTLATLGRLEPGGDVDRLITALSRAQGREDAASGSTRIADLRFLDARAAGDVWALWHLWSALDLEGLSLAWRRSRTELDVLACLRAMVFNRLCDPSSKLGVLRWLNTVALPRGFGFDAGPPEHQHLLRAMDVIDDHADAINERLAFLMRPLIDQELSVVFYDLTTVKVHGEAIVDGDVRDFGKSKDGGVARQFVLSLVQTADGLPIAHEVHPGNTAEAKTLLPMIRSLLARWPLKRVVLVADRGLLSLNNLQELAELQATLDAAGRGVRLEYVLAVPAARYGEFKAELQALDAAHSTADESPAAWVDEMRWTTGDVKDPDNPPRQYRLVVAHEPIAAQRRSLARRQQIQELTALGQQWGGRLDEQDAGKRKTWSSAVGLGRQGAAVPRRQGRQPGAPDQGRSAQRAVPVHYRRAAAAVPRRAGRQAATGDEHRRTGGRGGAALQEPGRHRARVPRAQERDRDWAGVPPAAQAHPCPRAGVLPGADPAPGAAHEVEGKQPTGVAGAAAGTTAAHPASDGANGRWAAASRADRDGR